MTSRVVDCVSPLQQPHLTPSPRCAHHTVCPSCYLRCSRNTVHGYYNQTYTSETPLSGSNLAVAFGGWADVTTALSDAAGTYSKMVGTKYLDIGGGNNNGYWTASVIT